MEDTVIEDATYHDNTIHSVEFIDEEYETKLVLDIDYISEWEECGDRCKFKISPASLIFEGVGDLDIKITKPGFTQQSYMDVILDIKTTELNGNRKKYVIQLLNESYIQFEATGSLLKVRGKALLKNEQHLTTSERENA